MERLRLRSPDDRRKLRAHALLARARDSPTGVEALSEVWARGARLRTSSNSASECGRPTGRARAPNPRAHCFITWCRAVRALPELLALSRGRLGASRASTGGREKRVDGFLHMNWLKGTGGSFSSLNESYWTVWHDFRVCIFLPVHAFLGSVRARRVLFRPACFSITPCRATCALSAACAPLHFAYGRQRGRDRASGGRAAELYTSRII